MFTKRQCRGVIITYLLMGGVMGLFKIWAAREAVEGEGGTVTTVAEAVIGLN